MQTLEIKDFGGGIVDSKYAGSPGRMSDMTNVELYESDSGKKIKQRRGFDPFTNRLGTGDQTIGGIFSHGQIAYAQSSSKLFNTSTGVAVSTPSTSTTAFSVISADTGTVTSYQSDPYHLFVMTHTYSSGQAIYAVHKDSTTTEVITPLTVPLPMAYYSSSGTGSGYSYGYRAHLRWVYYSYSFETGEYSQHVVNGPATSTQIVTTTMSNSVTYNYVTMKLGSSTYFNYGSSSATKGKLYLVLCRTTNGGTVYYEVSSTLVSYAGPFDLQTITDNVSDATLVTKSVAYFQTEMNNFALSDGWTPSYATITDNSMNYLKAMRMFNSHMYVLNYSSTVRHSKYANPREYGDTAYVDLPETTLALGATPNGVVVFCERNVFRIDGYFDDDGSGGMTVSKIGPANYPISASAVVDTPNGTYWLADDGVWFTDGVSLRKVSVKSSAYITGAIDGISFTNTRYINGCYVPSLNKVFWCISKNAVGNSASTILVYDEMMSDQDSEVFYKWYNSGATDTCVAAGSSNEYPLIIANSHGYLFNLANAVYSTVNYDRTYADSSTSTAWEKTAIQYSASTADIDFMDADSVKYAPMMHASFLVDSAPDYGVRLYASTYGSTDDYGLCTALSAENNKSGSSYSLKNILLPASVGVAVIKRHFPATKLRCKTRKLTFSNALVALYGHAEYGVTEINATLKTATFTDTASYDWPVEVVGYYISFETDSYVRNYLITARTADTLTFSDSGNYSVTGSSKGWIIRGYPKGQVFNLTGVKLFYETNGNGVDPYNTADSKEV